MAEYQKVHFRIETGYVWSEGHSEKDSKRFMDEVRRIFPILDFTIEESDRGCQTVHRRKESLYCHPMDISGVIRKDSIVLIRELIDNSSITLRTVDCFDEYHDRDRKWLLNELYAEKGHELREEFLSRFKTSSRNRYVQIMLSQSSPIKLVDETYTKDAYLEFQEGVMDELLEEGLLIESVTHKGAYRTINKTEQKEWLRKNKKSSQELEVAGILA